MTGAYLLVTRGGQQFKIEIEHLTLEELRERLNQDKPIELMQWIIMLCATVREAEQQLMKQDRLLNAVKDLADRWWDDVDKPEEVKPNGPDETKAG